MRCFAASGPDGDGHTEDLFGCKVTALKNREEHSFGAVMRVPVIDFGMLRCGCLSSMYLQLVNAGHVPCTWKSTECDVDFIRHTKALAPQKRAQLKVHR